MRVVLFGPTGMIGSGALIECLAHPDVERVLAVGRRPGGTRHDKLEELVHDDFSDFSRVEDRFVGWDACLFCLGVSAVGMTQQAYHRITHDFAVAAAAALSSASPRLVFCYVSGAGADSSEKGRVMWARVKGETENRLREMPLGGTWIFRPGYVQPVKGVRSRTRLYNVLYAVAGPLYPVFAAVLPNSVTTTEKVGLALIRAARNGAGRTILENRDINELAKAESSGT